jgi:hypothetical protein
MKTNNGLENNVLTNKLTITKAEKRKRILMQEE